MKFRVIYTVWGAEDQVFEGGEHEVDKPTVAFLRVLAGAEAAGSVEVIDDGGYREKLDSYVQSQADGETAHAAAVESGAWEVANLEQFELDVAYGARARELGANAPGEVTLTLADVESGMTAESEDN